MMTDNARGGGIMRDQERLTRVRGIVFYIALAVVAVGYLVTHIRH